MSLNRYARSRDLNEHEIVESLQRNGVFVYRLDRPLDLLCGYNRVWWVFEVKMPKGGLSDSQEAFISECSRLGLPCAVIRDAGQALELLGIASRGVEIGPRKFSSPWLDGTGDNG